MHMLPLTLLSAGLLLLCTFFMKKEVINTKNLKEDAGNTNILKVGIYTVLFIGCLLTVGRVVSFVIFLVVLLAAAGILS